MAELSGLTLTMESGSLLYLELATGEMIVLRTIPEGNKTKVKIQAPRGVDIRRNWKRKEVQ